ncbi:hypothetical protein SAMN02799633_02609 [Bacillus sp. UNCCL81]|nr:hypothetical protein SAMN02799633_02609 [Bacillus sp. UNCCL81]
MTKFTIDHKLAVVKGYLEGKERFHSIGKLFGTFHRHEFSLKKLLLLASIPRSTYYYWMKNLERPDPDTEIKVMIKEI